MRSLLFLLPLLSNAAFVLNVLPMDQACFIVRTPEGPEVTLVTGSFDLLDDKLVPDPVSVVLLNDKLEHIYKSEPYSRFGTFSVETMGRVSLCVRNGIDSPNQSKDRNLRIVGLDVQVKAVDSTSVITEGVQRVQTQIWNFKSHYDYMRMREGQHREVVEAAFTKLLVWSFVEATFVILASLTQIVYMRRFVERRRAF
jgi:hypothetical protein